MLRWSPWLLMMLMIAPVTLGMLAIILPAFGWLPALGQSEFTLEVWRKLLQVAGLGQSVTLSLSAGLLTPLIALTLVLLFLASSTGTRWSGFMQRLLAPLLAIPHAAAALGLVLLIAPSGFVLRLISPELTGWQRPPDLLIVHDTAGISMLAGLVVKEIPFLLLMSLAALPQLQADRRIIMARSLGYHPLLAWLWTVAPALYPLIRLPVFAVIAFASSTVDVALILGPTLPPPLGVRVVGWFNDPDLNLRLLASAAALLQLAVSASAILLWMAGEQAVRLIFRSLQSRGLRNTAARTLMVAGHSLMLMAIVVLVASVSLLLLTAFAGPWRFPAALPTMLTLQHWITALPLLQPAISNTLLLALVSTTVSITLVVATLENASRRDQRTISLSWALYVPLLVPQVAFLFGLVLLTEQLRWQPGLWLTAMAHCIFVLPYVYLTLSEPWRRHDPRWCQLAATLGSSPNQILWRIKMPMLLAPIATACAVGLAVSAGLYLPTLLIGAGRISTVTTEAVALASGSARSQAAVVALMQTLLPMAGFMLALLLPHLRWRQRRALRGQLT